MLGNATGQRGTRIQYVKETGILQVDRTQSGKTDFSGAFSGGAAAAVPLTDGKLNLTIVVDGVQRRGLRRRRQGGAQHAGLPAGR